MCNIIQFPLLNENDIDIVQKEYEKEKNILFSYFITHDSFDDRIVEELALRILPIV